MKLSRVIPVVCVAVLAARARAQSVKVENDKSADFASYTSFAWKSDVKAEGKPLESKYEGWVKMLAGNVENQLQGKGLARKPEAEASLLLVKSVTVEEKTAQITSRGFGRNDSGSGSTHDLNANGSRYRELNYTLALVDARTGKTVWNGKVMTEIETEDPPSERIKVSIEKLLKKYPPKAK